MRTTTTSDSNQAAPLINSLCTHIFFLIKKKKITSLKSPPPITPPVLSTLITPLLPYVGKHTGAEQTGVQRRASASQTRDGEPQNSIH